MPAALGTMTWLGRGPHENYWDRHTGATVSAPEAAASARAHGPAQLREFFAQERFLLQQEFGAALQYRPFACQDGKRLVIGSADDLAYRLL